MLSLASFGQVAEPEEIVILFGQIWLHPALSEQQDMNRCHRNLGRVEEDGNEGDQKRSSTVLWYFHFATTIPFLT